MEFQFADLLECLCDARPEQDVLVAGTKRVTRAELDERANRLAHHLRAQGFGHGDPIGIYSHNRLEWVEALLACWKIRAIAVNVNFRYVADELRYIWDNSDMVGLIYEGGFAEHVAELAPEFPAIREYLVLDDGRTPNGNVPGVTYEKALAARPPERDFDARSGDDIYLVYTGGTTGMPKGVLWRHEDWYFNVAHQVSPHVKRPEDVAGCVDSPFRMRSLTLSPLMHGGGQFPLLISLLNGGMGLLPVAQSFDPREVLEIIANEKATILSIIGDAMGRPIAETKLATGNAFDTSSLVAISTGGALLTDPVRKLIREAFGKVFITGGIGSSEIGAAAKETRAFDPATGPRFKLDANVAVLDDELHPIEPGSAKVGRLAKSGHIPLGYHKAEAKTAETFVTDENGVRWVIPGDWARVEEDETITLLGRGSECINSGGEKIFTDEVEGVIAQHPAVRHVVVVGVTDPKWMQRVVAIIELAEGCDLTLEDLQAHCRKHLARYKVPRGLLFAALQRTPTGKVDYVWAREFAENGCSE